jgi:radical SAM superfamily enzyme YgiQ (UPF0313 family)
VQPGSATPLKILLIHCQHEVQRFGVGLYRKYLRYAPLTMPTLAGLVPQELGAEVRVVDEMVEAVDLGATPDLVGLTAITSAAPRAYELAAHFGAKGAVTVLGGVHATLLPQEAAQHVDVVVRGYAEDSWPRLLRDHALGRLQRLYEADRCERIAPPARAHLRRTEYVAANTVEMSRGCSKRCDFCVAPRFHRRHLTRDVGEVIDEIRALPGKLVTFLDPNVVGNIPYARAFFNELRKLRRYWVGCVSIDVLRHPGLLELLVDSGAKGFLIGFESLSQEALDAVHKSFSQAGEYREAIDLFHRRGVMVQGSFVFGFDSDDAQVFARTAEFIIDARIELPQFTVLTPFPGTPLFERLDAQGRILHRDWSRYNGHHVVFTPQQMSAEQLRAGVRWTWARTYSYGAILRRLCGRPWLVKPVALLSNLNFRRYMRRVHFGS